MLKKFNVTDYERVQFEVTPDKPYILLIVQYDNYSYNYKEEIGHFDFYNMEGYLQLLNGSHKDYKRFNSLLNNFFEYNEMFMWNSVLVEDCKKAGANKRKAEKKQRDKEEKEAQTNKAYEYLSKVKNNDSQTFSSLQIFKDKTDSELLEIVKRSFKGIISEQLEIDIFNAIKEVYNMKLNKQPEEVETTENTQDNKHYIAFGKTFTTWLQAYEYCKENNLDALLIDEVEITNNTQEEVSYTAFNRSFSTYEEAESYCISNDFDTEYIKEVALQQPSDNQIETNEPILYHFYKQTFNTYMDAYNYAINNRSPVTMVIASNHPYITNERLQQLEYEYTFTKSNMSYSDMKEYFAYISELPITTDRDERYFKLKSYIQRYEYNERSRKAAENERECLSLEGTKLLVFMKEKGLEMESREGWQRYLYKGEHVYSFHSCSVEKYYNDMLALFNKYFSQYENEYNNSKVYFYKGNENTILDNDNFPTGWITYNSNIKIATFNRLLTDKELSHYQLIPYETIQEAI